MERELTENQVNWTNRLNAAAAAYQDGDEAAFEVVLEILAGKLRKALWAAAPPCDRSEAHGLSGSLARHFGDTIKRLDRETALAALSAILETLLVQLRSWRRDRDFYAHLHAALIHSAAKDAVRDRAVVTSRLQIERARRLKGWMAEGYAGEELVELERKWTDERRESQLRKAEKQFTDEFGAAPSESELEMYVVEQGIELEKFVEGRVDNILSGIAALTASSRSMDTSYGNVAGCSDDPFPAANGGHELELGDDTGSEISGAKRFATEAARAETADLFEVKPLFEVQRELVENQGEADALRAAGWTQSAIAAELGISVSKVDNLRRRTMRHTVDQPEEKFRKLLRKEFEIEVDKQVDVQLAVLMHAEAIQREARNEALLAYEAALAVTDVADKVRVAELKAKRDAALVAARTARQDLLDAIRKHWPVTLGEPKDPIELTKRMVVRFLDAVDVLCAGDYSKADVDEYLAARAEIFSERGSFRRIASEAGFVVGTGRRNIQRREYWVMARAGIADVNFSTF